MSELTNQPPLGPESDKDGSGMAERSPRGEQWKERVEEIFAQALEFTPQFRANFVTEACKGDAGLEMRVRRLLDAYEHAGTVLERTIDPAIELELARLKPEEAGNRIGAYRLVEQIGEGGFGVVWIAEQNAPVRRRVALKILKLGMDTKEVLARFEQERQALALMNHPSIARVLDAGATQHGRPFIVLELVDGVRITEYCDGKNLPMRKRLELFMAVCQAVQHAHQKGIIHRDLKPSNILVILQDGAPVPKIIDFGVAKAIQQRLSDLTVQTQIEQMIGTPLYMSPEQAEAGGLNVDTRTDIYALGVLLYELLTGRTPFDAATLMKASYEEMRRIIREEEPPKPSAALHTMASNVLTDVAYHRQTEPPTLIHAVCGDLDWIVMKALEKERSRRYETANGFALDVQRHLRCEPVVARPPSGMYRFERLVRRHRLVFAAAAAVAAALIVGLSVATVSLFNERKARRGEAEQRKVAEAETAKTRIANLENKKNLHLASMADFASAVKALDEDFNATLKGERAAGFAGKSRWHEGVALLTRSLERDQDNQLAAVRLYDTLRGRLAEKRDWPLQVLKDEFKILDAKFSPDGTRIASVGVNEYKIDPRGMKSHARIWDSVTGKPISGPIPSDSDIGFQNALEFTSDGTRVITLGLGGAQIWDAISGLPIGSPVGSNGDGGWGSKASQDGSKIIVTNTTVAQIWSTVTGNAVGKPMVHDRRIDSANFSPDGSQVVTTCQNGYSTDPDDRDNRRGYSQVWDATTGEAVGKPIHHQETQKSVVFSPDGFQILATGVRIVQLWDASSGDSRGEPMRHEDVVNSAIFSPDGSTILTASDDGTARVFDSATAKEVGEPLRHKSGVFRAIFSPDGTKIATASNETAHIWDAATHNAFGEPFPHGERILYIKFSPDGRSFLTGGSKVLRTWEVTSGEALSEPMLHSEPITAVGPVFSPDGSKVIAAADGTLRVWETAAGRKTDDFQRYPDHVLCISPDGSKIVSRGKGKILRISDIDPKQGTGGTTYSTESQDHTVRIRDAETGKVIGEPMLHESNVWTAKFSPNGSRIFTISHGSLQIWDAQTGKAIGKPIRHDNQVSAGSMPREWVSSATFSPDGSRIITTSLKSGQAQIWDTTTGQPIGARLQHSGRVDNTLFSPDGSKVVTLSYDEKSRTTEMQIWDATSGEAIGHIDKGGNSAKWNADGTRILTRNVGLDWHILDIATGEVIVTFRSETNGVHDANYSPDGSKVVIASFGGTMSIWDAVSGRALGKPMHVNWQGGWPDAKFSPDGSKVLTKGATMVQMWDATSSAPVDEPRVFKQGELIAQFNSSGSKVLITTGSNDKTTFRVWNVVSEDRRRSVAAVTPDVLAWARNVGGLRHSEEGELQLIPDFDRVAGIANAKLPEGPWSDLAQWTRTSSLRRTITPESKLTLRQFAERERDFDHEGTVESLESALRYDPTVPLVRLFLAAGWEKDNTVIREKILELETSRRLLSEEQSNRDSQTWRATQDKNLGILKEALKKKEIDLPQRAAFLRRYDLDALARNDAGMARDELAAHWMRAASHLRKLSPNTPIGIGSNATTASKSAEKAAQNAEATSPEAAAAWRKNEELAKSEAAKALLNPDEGQKRLISQLRTVLNNSVRQKNWTQAAADLSELEKLIPESQQAGLEVARFKILIGQKSYVAACQLAEKLSDAHPNDTKMLNDLAWRIITAEPTVPHDIDLAEKIATRANDAAKGEDPGILDTLARVWFVQGKTEAAIQLQDQAVTLATGKLKQTLQKTLDSYRKGELPKP